MTKCECGIFASELRCGLDCDCDCHDLWARRAEWKDEALSLRVSGRKLHTLVVTLISEIDDGERCPSCGVVWNLPTVRKVRKALKDTANEFFHRDHGRGTAENGPDDQGCGCRASEKESECASAGCGFCRVAK